MSMRKANAAGAKQKALNTNRTVRDTNVNKTMGGKCAGGCGSAATVKIGNVKFCRSCAEDYS